MERKEWLCLGLFLILVFAFQWSIADRVLFGDDYLFATFAKEKLFFYYENAHPPLPVWTDIALTTLFGVSNQSMRLTSILFSTLTVGLLYLLARRFFSVRVAWLSAILLAVSAYHIRASQMNSTSDGGMFTFFFLLTLHFVLCYFEKLESKYLCFSGIATGLTLWTRETGILLFPIIGLSLFLFYYHKEKKFWASVQKAWKPMLWICGIGVALFLIYPAIDLTFNHGQMLQTLFTRAETAVLKDAPTHGYLALFLYSVFKIVVWLGPLFLLLSLFWLFFVWKQKSWKEARQFVFLLTFFCVFLFYFTVTPPNLDRSRYVMVLLPVFALFSGQALDYLFSRFSFGSVVALVFCTALFFCFFLWMNTHIEVVSYEGSQNQFHQIAAGNIFFSVPLFTETDNSGMLFNFSIIIVAFVLGLLFFSVSFGLFHWKNVSLFFLVLFLSVGLGYNVALAEEYSLHWTSPNYSNAVKELIAYSSSHQLKESIYLLKNYELKYYLGEEMLQYRNSTFITRYGIPETDKAKIAAFAQELDEHGGTVIFTDMPPMDKNGLLWKTITEKCVRNLTVTDKEIEIGWILNC